MKKIFFIGLAAVAVLASCSKDETIEVAGKQAISFDSFVNLSTKGAADDLTSETFRSFQVWGLMEKDGQTGTPFVGTEVKSADGNSWSYDTPVYWENGYKYSFVAVAPSNSEAWTLNAPETVGTWGSINFTNGEGTTDLIYDIDGFYATSPVELSENQCPGPISFTFNHLLSRVRFTFTNSMADNSTLNVTDVKVVNANNKAVATLGETATWALAGDNAVTELAFGNVILDEEAVNFASGETKATDHKYMIPMMSEGQTYQLSFKITRVHSGVTDEYNHIVNLPAVTWEAGSSYSFNATISAANVNPDTQLCPIVFNASVEDWGEFGDDIKIPDSEDGE